MKLRDQILVLLLLPLICQLVSTLLVISSFSRVDEVARREAAAKKVVALSQEIGNLHSQVVLKASMPDYFFSQGDENSILPLTQKIAAKNAALRDLTKDNPVAAKIANYIDRCSTKLLTNVQDLAGAFSREDGKLFYSQYMSGIEQLEATKVLVDKMSKNNEKLLQIYGKAAKEFEPEEMSARRDMRNSLLFAFFANVLLVIGLAIAIHRNTLRRLSILMENMNHFAKGNTAHAALKGSDEIAELDSRFAKIAEERNQLEEVRKSMRAIVSHDLRAPLTSMGINLELVLSPEFSSLPANASKVIRRVLSETQRLQRLANTLLDMDKLENGTLHLQREHLSCNLLLVDAVAVMLPLAETKGVELKQDCDQELTCYCDSERTLQVLVNLISNALKFSPKKGTIVVRARSVNNTSRFEILDEGPGIPEDKVTLLFNKFRQLDQSDEIKRQGSGLGLYICRLLITVQDGQIGYTSRSEGGSCFWFELTATRAVNETPRDSTFGL